MVFLRLIAAAGILFFIACNTTENSSDVPAGYQEATIPSLNIWQCEDSNLVVYTRNPAYYIPGFTPKLIGDSLGNCYYPYANDSGLFYAYSDNENTFYEYIQHQSAQGDSIFSAMIQSGKLEDTLLAKDSTTLTSPNFDTTISSANLDTATDKFTVDVPESLLIVNNYDSSTQALKVNRIVITAAGVDTVKDTSSGTGYFTTNTVLSFNARDIVSGNNLDNLVYYVGLYGPSRTDGQPLLQTIVPLNVVTINSDSESNGFYGCELTSPNQSCTAYDSSYNTYAPPNGFTAKTVIKVGTAIVVDTSLNFTGTYDTTRNAVLIYRKSVESGTRNYSNLSYNLNHKGFELPGGKFLGQIQLYLPPN